jgi:hypothetical protein
MPTICPERILTLATNVVTTAEVVEEENDGDSLERIVYS